MSSCTQRCCWGYWSALDRATQHFIYSNGRQFLARFEEFSHFILFFVLKINSLLNNSSRLSPSIMNALYMKRATNLQFRDPRELTPASYPLQVGSFFTLNWILLGYECRCGPRLLRQRSLESKKWDWLYIWFWKEISTNDKDIERKEKSPRTWIIQHAWNNG